MSAAIYSPVARASLAKLGKIKQECETALYYGKTRQAWEWSRLDQSEKKLLLTLAGVGSIDSLESMAARSYHELTPVERDAVAVAHRSLRRMLNKSHSLGALGAGIA